ncbi:MAG: hypothetical protein J7513_17575 [Solirubrobacteraceae bacterium]|nr:hypothetical protein [Solirubrobacteraceae bacterium]
MSAPVPLRRWIAAGLLATATLTGCGGGDDPNAATKRTPKATTVAAADDGVLHDDDSGFSIEAPAGYTLTVRDGVYVLRSKDGDRSLSFSRTATAASPTDYGDALLGAVGGEQVSREADETVFTAETDAGGERNTILINGEQGALAVFAGRSPTSDPFDLQMVRQIANTVQGGYTLTPASSGGGGGAAAPELPLQRYSSGGVSGLVPSGSEWRISDNQGSLEGSSDQGSFLFGFSIDVMPPANAPAGFNGPVFDYLPPADALASVFPKLNPNVRDYAITQTLADGVLPSFTASQLLQFTYTSGGKPWVGAALVATDSPQKYSNFTWKLYYSGIGVPRGSDGSVGAGLMKAWRSWNPSGAIAQRSAQAKQLMDETNDAWSGVSEFRAKTADRQSRDVGCLLQGYYDVEDNSRKYDLPPAPCGQEYRPEGGSG